MMYLGVKGHPVYNSVSVMGDCLHSTQGMFSEGHVRIFGTILSIFTYILNYFITQSLKKRNRDKIINDDLGGKKVKKR